MAWGESVVLTLLFPLVGYWITPEDPFLINRAFPWLVLAPVLPALRYGFAHGFVSALLLLGLIAIHGIINGLGIEQFPAELAIGMVILAMLSGEFRDVWQRQLTQQKVINDYQRMRLDEFTRNYHLLKVSHDRLEHRLAASSHSLRGALLDLRRQLQQGGEEMTSLKAISEKICGLFAGFGWVQVGSLHEVRGEHIVVRPLATLGKPRPVDPFDPMIRRAIVEKRLISLREELLTSEHASDEDLLAVVPLVDVNRHVWGLLLLQEVPFVALHLDNLRLLAVLGGHIGDILSSSLGVSGEEPDDHELAVFRRELERAIVDFREYGLPATLLAIEFPAHHPECEDMVNLFVSQTRGLDRVLRPRAEQQMPSLFLLMPLTSSQELEAYRRRMNAQLEQRLGSDMEALGIRIHEREIGRRDSVQALMEWLHETTHSNRHTDPGSERTGA